MAAMTSSQRPKDEPKKRKNSSDDDSDKDDWSIITNDRKLSNYNKVLIKYQRFIIFWLICYKFIRMKNTK